MDLKGEKGDQGQIGPQGPQGPAGQDYVLTEDDKTAIANIVIGVLPTAEEVNV